MGILDHLSCLLRNLYAGQKATVRTGHGTTDCFQIRKEVHQGYILSHCLFNLYTGYIMQNAGLEEAQAGNKITGRSINNLRYADDMTLYDKKRTKEPLDEGESGEGKSWVKTQRSENYHLVRPITLWQIDGETMETVRGFIFLDSKITAR